MLYKNKGNNFFSSKSFEWVGLLGVQENYCTTTQYNVEHHVKKPFKNFISSLKLDEIFDISYLYDYNIASYNCILFFSHPEKSDLENYNNYGYIQIRFNPAGITIKFVVNNQSDDKERLINNCKKLLNSEVKESFINFEQLEDFFFTVKLSNSICKQKQFLKIYYDFRDLLKDLTEKIVFDNEDIRVFKEIEKKEVLNFYDDRLINKVRRILILFLPLLILANLDDLIYIIEPYLNYQNYNFFYGSKKCSKDIGIDETELQRWVNSLNRKGQIILQGPPGTGKTFIAKKLAEHFTRGRDGFSEIIQFHPSYSYEDFIQGIRPRTENGQLTYDLVPGRFLEFCKKAEAYDDICVLIIDEINRANLSNVFGELMYLLEYRDQEINLAGSYEPFKIPKNVRIIGTMNTADRSIALVDHALRRRFAFIKIAPNYNILKRYYEDDEINFSIDQLIQVLQDINKMINDPNYEIGISFFMIGNIEDNLQDIWEMEIEPYLEEYFYNALDKIDQFRWNQVKIKLGLNADENN